MCSSNTWFRRIHAGPNRVGLCIIHYTSIVIFTYRNIQSNTATSNSAGKLDVFEYAVFECLQKTTTTKKKKKKKKKEKKKLV